MNSSADSVQELFSKLRFSYLEQVTKEKFLRAIVGDPPLVVGHNENVELEAQLVQTKEELRRKKEEVRVMVEELEKKGRDLARRKFSNAIVFDACWDVLTEVALGYQNIQLQTTQLSTLPESIANLDSTIASLRAKQAAHASAVDPSNPSSSQNLSLPATLSLLAEREAELAAIERQLTSLHSALPRKTREAEAMERELSVLERRRNEAVAQAQEAKRRKREGESDGLEEMGRWYRSAEANLKQLVNVET